MTSLIVYSSQSGNTKKLAETVFDTLPGAKEIFPVDEAPDGAGYDLVAVGFWLMAGKPDPKTATYLSTLKTGTRLFLFATHGAAAGSDHAKNAMAEAVTLADGAAVAGTFSCQGEVLEKVLEKVKQKPTPPVWIGDADQAVGHPDPADLAALADKVRELS